MKKRIDRSFLGWDNNRDHQILWVNILNWDYKLFVESFRSHRTTFQFEGIVRQMPEGLKGLDVTGDIEVPLEVEYPDDETPPDRQGFIHLVDECAKQFLGVTLFCNRDTYNELFRLFSSAFANVGGVGLQLDLHKPENATKEFWKTTWQKQEVNISRFGIYAGGKRLKTFWRQNLFSS